MSQHDPSPDGDADEDGPDSWFRPVWDDVPDETDEPLPSRSAGPLPRCGAASRPADEAAHLLGPLAAAADALTRLDAQAAVLAPALPVGLIARLACVESAGWLAAQGLTVHPMALALRETERLGRPELY